MRGQLRIDSMYAYIVEDDDGTEGIPAMDVDGMPMPMVGADMDRMMSLRPTAVDVVRRLMKPVELVRFSTRQHLEWIDDQKPLRPRPDPTPKRREAFKTFDEPVLSEAQVGVADGVEVAAAIIDGQPCVVLTFIVGSEQKPVALVGQVAADLSPLAHDAWESAKALQS